MKQFKLTFLLTLLMCLVKAKSFAYTAEIEGIYYAFSGTEATVTYNPNYLYTGEVVIPETVTYKATNYTVTSIGGFAFSNCSGLTSVIIPNSVISIGKSAFSGCSGLTSVIFPNSVTSIESSTFWKCSSLKSVTIPNSVTSIGSYAFEGCSSLTSVIIPNSVISIGESAFSGCSGLTSVIFPNSVTSIKSSTFWKCSSLKSVTIPNSVKSIGSYAFEGCSSLTSVEIPNSVTSIEEGAFSGCSSLTKVTIGSGVTSIGGFAFYGCENIREFFSYILNPFPVNFSAFSFPDNNGSAWGGYRPTAVLYVPHSTMDAYKNTEGWEIFGNIAEIGEASLYSDSKYEYLIWPKKHEARIINGISEVDENLLIDNVTIENLDYTITGIGPNAFSNHSEITSVTLSKNLTFIGAYAFDKCKNIKMIFSKIVEPFVLDDYTLPSHYSSYVLYVPYGSKDAYHATSGWGYTIDEFGELWNDQETNVNYTYNIEQKEAKVILSPVANGTIRIKSNLTIDGIDYAVKRIGDYAFRNCTELTTVMFPECVTDISDYAFYNCCGLTSVTIPNSVVSIGDYAFAACSGLTSIDIGNNVTRIGDGAFGSCSGLTSINIGNNITKIGGGAFLGCSGLTSVYISDLEAWCKISFEGNPSFNAYHLFLNGVEIKDLVIPNSVTSIGQWVFSGCSGLTSLTINNNVTSISRETFDGCTELKTLYVNCNVMGSYFAPKQINTVIWGNQATTIDGSAFYACSDLKSITIPSNVTYICKGAFSGCNNLSSVTIQEGDITIEKDAFSGCTGLTKMYLDCYKIDSWFSKNNTIKEVFLGEHVTSIGQYAFSYYSISSIDIPSNVASIGSSAFANCFTLENVILPNSVDTIQSNTFANCRGLSSITIPSGIVSIGERAFEDCTSLVAVSLPESIVDIGRNAFAGCIRLATINLPAKLTSISNGLFLNCTSLNNIIIPQNVDYIGVSAFRKCESLTNIVFPESLSVIESLALDSCVSLANVLLPEKLTRIKTGAFEKCTSLTSITIPKNVKYIDRAFDGCNNLTDIRILSDVLEYLDWLLFFTTWWQNQPDGLVYCDKYLVGYKGEKPIGEVVIRNDVIGIANGALSGGCEKMTKLIIPEGMKYIGESAFGGCDSLNSISIPSSVVKVGYGAFYGNNAQSIVVAEGNKYYDSRMNGNAVIRTSDNVLITGGPNTIIPPSVTSIAPRAFMINKNITSITIPGNVSDIGSQAFYYCSGLKNVIISEGVKIIGYASFEMCENLSFVSIPSTTTSIDKYAFHVCYLDSVYSYIYNPFPIDESVFSDYANGVSSFSPAILYVPAGCSSYYRSTEGWENFRVIKELRKMPSITLAVTTEDGTDVSDDVSVAWYDKDGKVIGNGLSIRGLEEDTKVYYSVLLGEELGRIYREVILQEAVSNEEAITCQLEKIGRVTLEGRVSATDIDNNTVSVNISQMLNGKWEQAYHTQTNEQGLFNVEVYDDETDIILSGEGYLDATFHRNGFSGNGNVGTIPLNLITGFSIVANITMQKAVAIGEIEEVTAWEDGLNNIEFTLTNATKGTDITDFTVQNGNVIIKTGADVGDEINLTAKSKQGIFANATTTFTITEGANAFDLQLMEFGGINATCVGSNNDVTVGYLYNSNDMLTAKGTYTGETLRLRHLPSGTYTLITMGGSTLLHNMTSLADITSVGLSEGTDYVATNVEITDGKLTETDVNEVPQLDDTRFYYTTANTYFNADKSSLTIGNYLTLQAHVDFKAEHAEIVDDVTLTIDLPQGCQMVENSVVANHQVLAYTMNENQLTIQLTKEQYNSRILFCVIPTINQSYTISAMASFDIDGQVQQPIGTTQFEAKGLSLSAPKYVSKTDITINGTAIGHSEVSIYDNDVLIGKATSKADGSWTAQCELFKPYNHSFHSIHAKITTEEGLELTSETQQVEYDRGNIMPEKVTMLYYNPEYVGQYNIVFNLINGTTIPSSYYYFPYKNWPNWYETRETEPKNFTFLANFTNNDTTQIKNVNIKVLNSDGTIRTLPAIFDAQQDAWVATTKYSSSNKLPRNATVEYDLISRGEFVIDEERIEEENINIHNIIETCIENVKESPYKIEIETEDSIIVTCNSDSDNKFLLSISKIGYDELAYYMDNAIVISTDKGNYNISDSISDNKNIIVLWDDINAYKIVFSNVEENVSNSRKRAPWSQWFDPERHPGLNRFSRTINRLYGNGRWIDLCDEINYWRQQLIQYKNNHIDYRKRTQKLLLATCDDGTYRLNSSQIEWGNMYKGIYDNDADRFEQYLEERIERYATSIGRRIYVSAGVQAALIASSWAFQHFTQIGRSFATWLNQDVNLRYAYDQLETEGINSVSNGIGNMASGTIPNSISAVLGPWCHNEEMKIAQSYVSLNESIQNAYKKCDKKEEEEEEQEEQEEYNDDSNENKPNFPAEDTQELIDPSGFVYEAVLTNRLEGVTTTCYQQVNGEAVIWNAEDYSQQNPLKTDATGFYRWDVPQGMWQVKYEKEGYETAYSDWLPVPPPQLDVNIGMKQNTPPTVKQMRGTESGITIEMGKYMLPATMTTQNITVTRNGETEEGGIELLNVEQAPSSDEAFVSKVKFVPDNHFHTTDVVVVTVHKEVESYCGVPMTADHVETVKIERDITALVVDSVVTIPYHGERELQVLVLPKDAAAGRTLHVRTSSPMIASVSEEDVSINENGVATLTIGGKLPGGAVVDFTVEGTDATATSKIKVVMDGDDLVAAPTASIASGNTVLQGTQVTLSCATEEATIYYTLDGTCPCDEQARQLYSGPITIIGDVTIKAIAVKKGMDDSDVATFIYLTFPVNVTAKSYTRQYGEANPMFEYAVSSGALQGTPEIVCEATKESPVGTYDIVIRQGSVANYNVVYVNGLLTIEKAPLTISAGTYTIKQGDPMPEFTLTYEGFKNNETTAVLTKMPVVSCDAVDSSAPGEYPITVSGAEATNYDVSYMTGKLIVTERPIYILMYVVDGEEYKRYSLQEGDAIIPEKEPIKEGYTFSGWSEIPETMPAHDVTVTGTFSINSYTLTYMIDGEVYKQVVYEYGATITPEPQPEGDYVSFEWTGVPETMPAHDVTVTAVYETGIAEIMMMAQQGQVRIYSPNGKRFSKPQKGLNIVVMQDGTTRKVVVK